MNSKELMDQIADSYRIDPDYTRRVTEAAEARPVRRRILRNALLTAAVIVILAATATAAGMGLLDRRLTPNEYEGRVISERMSGYLATHLNDVVLEGTTADGMHIVFTNLLAESRFLYLEVLAERTDGTPFTEDEYGQRIDSMIYFDHFGIHYGEAGSEGGDWSAGLGSVWVPTRLDDGSDPCFVHFAARVVLLQSGYNYEQLTQPDKTRLTVQLFSGEKRLFPSDGILDETTVTLEDPETLRTVRLSNGRTVRLSALGAEILGMDMYTVKQDGIDPQDFGVILADGSRVPFLQGGDLSWSSLIPVEVKKAALAYAEILDPAQITGLYAGDRIFSITEDGIEP